MRCDELTQSGGRLVRRGFQLWIIRQHTRVDACAAFDSIHMMFSGTHPASSKRIARLAVQEGAPGPSSAPTHLLGAHARATVVAYIATRALNKLALRRRWQRPALGRAECLELEQSARLQVGYYLQSYNWAA